MTGLDIDSPRRTRELVLSASRRIGPDRPCFVIAEAGVNHDGDPEVARELVRVAAAAGAEAVKFQTFDAERLATARAPKAAYQERSGVAGESQLEMLRRLQLPTELLGELKRLAESLGLVFLSTPFDEASCDLLDELQVQAFKVASGELTNLPLLAHIAAKGRPMIVSTGMADLEEVERAVATAEAAGASGLALLHCVSSYPADPADANLRAMETLRSAFGYPVGFSDHTRGLEVALAAVALGASVLEKHFTLDRSRPGPDHAASLEPGELEALVRGLRTVESALGDGRKRPAACEKEMARVARRSLVAARDIRRGETLGESDLAARRPGTGLAPDQAGRLLGRRARRDVAAGEPLTLEMVE